MRNIALCLTAMLFLVITGCSRKSNGIYGVSGTVTYNGSPATGATVFFRRSGAAPTNDQLIMGIVQKSGDFELVCGSVGNGAPPGEYDVLVEWKVVTGQSNGRLQHGPDKLNGRYSDAKQPRLHASVKAQRNRLPPFDLTE